MSRDSTVPTVKVEDIARSATRRTSESGIESRPLSAWSDLNSFVLLAEPGGGKSCAFQFEASKTSGVYVKARRFANLGAPDGWHGETLFIDGLDEMRADATSRNGPLDSIVQRLNELGRPKFRLSCREADWLVAVDHEALREVAPDKQLDALSLDPLNDDDVLQLLRRRPDKVVDPQQFLQEAEARGLEGLLRNPLLLELLADAVGGGWPRGRADIYRLACERMASENNEAIRNARSLATPPLAQTLDDAGLLCAVLLLAGLDALVIGTATDLFAETAVHSLSPALGVVDANGALSSKLFIAEGQRRFPRHRSVAEYLAARVIGHRVTQNGLPMSRVLSLMTGLDGGVVEPLRGLSAWLGVTCPLKRATLIDRDPLACVLYGDVHAFGHDDKLRVLDGLRRESERFVWFRKGNWAAHPFGALGTADMAPEFATLFGSPDRQSAHQSLMDCALDAVRHGDKMPQLLPSLESIICDSSYRSDLRSSALEAWLAQSGTHLSPARGWLDEIRDGTIDDPRDELCGRLLEVLYPELLAPADVMYYFHPSKTRNFVGAYRHFWSVHLLARTPEPARPIVADALAEMALPKDALRAHYELLPLLGQWIAAALEALGSSIDVGRVAKWLALALDEYGSAALKGEDAHGIRDWLERHPEVQKSLVANAYAGVLPDHQTGRFHFWACEEILYSARRPRDWFRWLLKQATFAASAPLAEHCFSDAARVALNPTSKFDISLEHIERWVAAHRARWSQADQWLEQACSLPLDHWLGKQHRRHLEYAAENAASRTARRTALVEHVLGIETGRASPDLMYKVAFSYRGHFTDIQGETPEERVRELLVGSAQEAARAIAGLEVTLTRTDLPSVTEILAADLEQRHHFLRPACLLGAELAVARDSNVPHGWSDDLVRRLVAFRLTDSTGDTPHWYKLLGEHRPAPVGEVLGTYARQCLISRAEQSITGLWPLAREDAHAELARIVIPTLLRDFPIRARTAQLRRLNTELLPAALRHLPPDEFKSIINKRLAMPNLSSGQRIAWLLVGLRFGAHLRSRQLRQLVGQSRARALRLGGTLDMQMDHAKAWPPLPPAALARLIAMLAPHSAPEYSTEPEWMGTRQGLRNLVRGLTQQLAVSDHEDAAEEIERLRTMPALSAWMILLDAALFDHVRAIRSARFSHATAESVARVLSGQAPANALDLVALVQQHLEDLQARLRGDDTNSLRRFWRDPTDKENRPRTENECRDLLLEKLRDSLGRQGVTLHKEAAHANDTRADLRAETMVATQRRVVPIEIKKEDHRQLWTAWREQLEHRYMTDPAAEDVGIYLVLWFGHKPFGDADGVVPASAVQLKERLTALVPPEDRIRLQICVLDLSLVSKQSHKARRLKPSPW